MIPGSPGPVPAEIRRSGSAEDLEAQIGDLARIVAAGLTQLDGCGLCSAEQPDAVAQQHRHQVDEDLIHEPRADALSRKVSPENPDVLGTCRLLGGGDGLLDADGQERDAVGSLPWPVSEHEDRPQPGAP
jgi:hypothetical protein